MILYEGANSLKNISIISWHLQSPVIQKTKIESKIVLCQLAIISSRPKHHKEIWAVSHILIFILFAFGLVFMFFGLHLCKSTKLMFYFICCFRVTISVYSQQVILGMVFTSLLVLVPALIVCNFLQRVFSQFTDSIHKFTRLPSKMDKSFESSW